MKSKASSKEPKPGRENGKPDGSKIVRIEDVKIADIEMGERIRKDLGEIHSFAQEINEIGLLYPVLVIERKAAEAQRRFVLVDGERRIKASLELGHDRILARIVDVSSVIRGEYSANVFRKQFTTTEIVLILEKVGETRIGHRPKSGGVLNASSEKGVVVTPFQRGKTRDIASEITGASKSTIAQIMEMVVAARSDPIYSTFVSDSNSGKSLSQVYKQFSKFRLAKKLDDPPMGKFDLILVKPEWATRSPSSIKRGLIVGSQSESTQILSFNQVCNLEIPAEENAVLFFLAKDEHLEASLKLIHAFGFKFVEDLTIVIDDRPEGYFATKQHEHLLIAKTGKLEKVEKSNRPSTIHSKQTETEASDSVYRIVEKICRKNSRKLQIFGEESDLASKSGWKYWLSSPSSKQMQNYHSE